jgi:prepilin-type N-terminal cleavage/methylation domain-containing protein
MKQSKVLFKKKWFFGRGMTLVEVLISVTIFAMLSAAIYSSMTFVARIGLSSKAKVLASNIAVEELELVRNMSYDAVGVIAGSPSGALPQNKTVVSGNYSFDVSFDVRYIDDPFDGLVSDTSPDTNPADYKLVQAVVSCAQCLDFQPVKMTTTVAPNGLEGAGVYGFLFLRVVNIAGQPVPQASVHIASTNLNPQRVIDSVTGNDGYLRILDLEPSFQGYHITATKAGYSTDFTNTPSVDNPNPYNPDITIELGKVAPASLAIDLVSTLNITTTTNNCVPIGPLDFTIHGTTKFLDMASTIYKYSENFSTDGSGVATLSDLEWDNYDVDIIPGQGYDIAGYIPLSPVKIDPGSINSLKIILVPHIANKNSLLLTIKDGATLLPLTDIDIKLYEGLSGWEYTPHPVTGQGYFMQTDWSGISGQQDFNVDETGFWSTDGNLNITNPTGKIRLDKVGSDYLPSGELVSSTFDTGVINSSFVKIGWEPILQPLQVGAGSVKFQIATSSTNNLTTVWDFIGPDGTNSTYYDETSQNINPISNGFRFVRYKIILSTQDSSKTPEVENVAISFNSGCTPPGQAIFTGLSNGNFSIDALDTRLPAIYQFFTGTINATGMTKYEILMSP